MPVLGTTIIDNSDPDLVGLYARLLMMGAIGYLGGKLGPDERSIYERTLAPNATASRARRIASS